MVMLYDPGACYGNQEKTWEVLLCPELRDAPALVAYTEVPVCVLGKADVRVRVHEQEKRLQVYVVAEDDSPLFGLDWCLAFRLPFPQAVQVHAVTMKTGEVRTDDALVKTFMLYSCV
ncbi:hypothetical protein M514_07800 [Trichuris suis]|uniref:Uncharacterized protein n=1 Tax=Trichuris suis TaxID=68888 RepID=A0A085MUI4_9BILA|nr:hypothetical protein M513_07800 [Trichuris suis]KFD60880.1 hypothetical protein M514_07800 [Trichuris suis]